MLDKRHNRDQPKMPDNFGFDLEIHLQDKTYVNKLNKHINSQVDLIKNFQREGGAKQHYDQLAHILKGYIGLQKVTKKSETRSMINKKRK